MLDDNIQAIGRDKLILEETTKMHRSEKVQIKKTIDINCNNAGDIGQVKSKEEQRKELEEELQSFKFLDAQNDKSILEEGKNIFDCIKFRRHCLYRILDSKKLAASNLAFQVSSRDS